MDEIESAQEIAVRFAYVALFRNYVSGMWGHPHFYDLTVLEARGHVEWSNGLVRLSPAGVAYWSEHIKGRWSPHQKMSKHVKKVVG